MMYYFGTDLSQAGHYFWGLKDDRLVSKYADSSIPQFKDIPFQPEELTNPENGYRLERGIIRWHRIGGYTICAIVGSCIDHRGGCKSVFFVKEELTNEEMIERMKSIPIVMKIINQMPFPVEHFKPQNT